MACHTQNLIFVTIVGTFCVGNKPKSHVHNIPLEVHQLLP